jgi:hypothetical protein
MVLVLMCMQLQEPQLAQLVSLLQLRQVAAADLLEKRCNASAAVAWRLHGPISCTSMVLASTQLREHAPPPAAALLACCGSNEHLCTL